MARDETRRRTIANNNYNINPLPPGDAQRVIELCMSVRTSFCTLYLTLYAQINDNEQGGGVTYVRGLPLSCR